MERDSLLLCISMSLRICILNQGKFWFTPQNPPTGPEANEMVSRRWHEHDPQELVNSVEECIEKATEKFLGQGHKKSDIKAIGITNQRETTICWDTNTGEPLYNAIVWPDTRTATLVRELKDREGADKLQQLCG